MAETYLFNIADKVLGKLGSLALQEVRLAYSLEGELDKLESTISTIRAVLLDAEDQQTNNRQLTDWLGKIKDSLYDADDVLDEFEYEALRSQVVNRGGIKGKVRNFFSHSNPLAFRLKMGHKIKYITQNLDKIAAEKTKFHLTERFVDRRVAHGERGMTHSFVRASDVIGRDVDKERIVRLLMHPVDGENVSIFPIVGIAGLGKTTLAKLAYNDERISRNFELKMWVCVSEVFDVTKLIKEISKSALVGSNDGLTNDQLQTLLRSTLEDKKFLLILDDVWNDDRGKWIELRDLLLGGANGSKIVVTTRSQLVASIMGTVHAYNLKGLSEKDCLSLFLKWAFREGEERRYPNLMKIGEKIVKKCRGVPLAVRTLGSLLYLKTDEHDWLFIKDNEIWKFEQKENDILPALKLSYDQMPSYLKQCFIYCSIFPKDYDFIEHELTQFWIAQGLLRSSGENRELEDIGHQYFKELWSRSFFQDVEDHDTFLTFKMHDLVHDLALSMAQTECLSVHLHTHDISKRVRHLSFLGKDSFREELPSFLLELKNVQTIFFSGEGVEPTGTQSFVETCISRFKSMRVLHLSFSCFEVLPSSIGDLKHLRCLILSHNRRIQRLPDSICKLHNLQTLDLGGCSALEEFPRDIGNLISLRCFYLTTNQMCLPKEGFGSLISLRYFVVTGCENLISLGEGMQCLTALRTLIIENCESLESLPRSMKYLTALETLVISDCEKLNLTKWDGDNQGLKMSLRSLWITGLPLSVALPQWLQGAADTLQFISIIDCCNLACLPEWFKNLTSLQKLEFKKCCALSFFHEEMNPYRNAVGEWITQGCPGKDWCKIAHVPEITIDGRTIKIENEIINKLMMTHTRRHRIGIDYEQVNDDSYEEASHRD